MIHQDCYNKYYTMNYFNDHIEIKINFIPKDNFNKAKIYFDLVVFYKIDNTVIKYKNKIFHNEEELEYFSQFCKPQKHNKWFYKNSNQFLF